MARPEDKDKKFLEGRVIALSLHIQKLADDIESITDNIDVLRLVHMMRLDARVIQISGIEYQPRQKELKEIEQRVKKYGFGNSD